MVQNAAIAVKKKKKRKRERNISGLWLGSLELKHGLADRRWCVMLMEAAQSTTGCLVVGLVVVACVGGKLLQPWRGQAFC